MTQQPLTIVGSGMVTGVGLSAPACCAAIRCDISNFQETRFIDSAGQWIIASEVSLDQPWRGAEKLARMLALVIEESFDSDPALLPSETPIIVCFSERERPGRPSRLNERVLDALQKLLDFDMQRSSMTVSQGRVGGAVALREARRLIYEQQSEAVVIAGVDSYLAAETLREFEEKRRLLTVENSDGFVPGEGASAVIAKRPRPSEEPQLLLIGLGFGVEEATVESEDPLRADGLVQAMKAALHEARTDIGSLDFRIADISGEQYSFREASLAVTRILRTIKEDFDIWHAADCVAETGSAAGPIALNVAWHACENEYSKGQKILCHFGNDDGKRASIVLTYQPVKHRGQ
jgi:3-oxoacyl-[acyl-carrier-protein] synthase-1